MELASQVLTGWHSPGPLYRRAAVRRRRRPLARHDAHEQIDPPNATSPPGPIHCSIPIFSPPLAATVPQTSSSAADAS